MILTRLALMARRLTKRASRSTSDGLLSAKQFARVLARERSRSDRTGEAFSLIIFDLEGNGSPDLVPHLAAILQRRLRLTDDAGLLERRQVGVVLPDTPPDGAWTVVDDVCMSIPAGLRLPDCSVYCYPTLWPLEDGLGDGDDVERTAGDRPVRALESLFIRRLPAWKRIIDVAGASFALLMLSPLLAVVAAMIKATSPGPVLFRQKRSGLGGRPFVMLKFRTMVADAESHKPRLMALNEQDGPAFKIKDDPRITRLGRFLRQTSIDELPQFWNVLRGEMSLVGPRPPLYSEVVQYQTWYRQRLEVTPGLTCIWQTEGRSQVSFAEWMRMDVRYIRSRFQFVGDLKLLLHTIPAILFHRGY